MPAIQTIKDINALLDSLNITAPERMTVSRVANRLARVAASIALEECAKAGLEHRQWQIESAAIATVLKVVAVVDQDDAGDALATMNRPDRFEQT